MKNYDEEWYKCLDKQIETDINMYKNIDLSAAEKIEKAKYHYLQITIKDNILQETIDFTNDQQGRLKNINDLITIAINYSIKNNLPKINGTFFFRTNDSYEYKYNYPTFSFAKPKNKPGLLYPDFNFLKLFNKIKKIDLHCNDNKINKIYFKGNPTSKKRSAIREKMSLLSNPFEINIDKKYKPYYNICKYKFLLDLPGNKPWSIRLIELYMSKSLPIRVILYNKKWGEDIWIQFYENMFPNKISYIEVKYDVNYDKEISDNIVNEIKNKCLIIYNYFNNKSKLYKYITNTNYKKVKSITIDHIGYYMYNILIKCNQLVNNK